MKRLSILLFFVTIAVTTAFADAIGQWTLYPAFADITDIEPAGNRIYVLSSSHLFVYNLNDNSIEEISREQGLNGTEINNIAWNKTVKKLVILYSDSNIDILDSNGNVTPMPDLRDKMSTLDKTVNDIFIFDKFAYLATGFGIIKIDLVKDIFSESYNLGKNIAQCVIAHNIILAYDYNHSDLYSNTLGNNLLDKNTWKTLIKGRNLGNLGLLNDNIIAAVPNWGLYIINHETGDLTNISPDKFNKFYNHDASIITITDNKANIFRSANDKITFITDGYNPTMTVFDKTNNCIWANDINNKLAQFKTDADGKHVMTLSGIAPIGPSNDHFWRMTTHNGKFISPAGLYTYGNDIAQKGFIHILEDDNNWSSFDFSGIEETTGHLFVDANSIAFDPSDDNHFFVGCRTGLYEFRDGKLVKNYTMENSPLLSPINDVNFTIISALLYDEDGTLWVFNSHNETVIFSLSKNGEWKSYPHPEFKESFGRDIQTPFISKIDGCMWFTNTSWSSSCLYRYDYHNDKITAFKTLVNQDGKLFPDGTMFLSCTEDNEGNIWVASSEGPLMLTPEDRNAGHSIFTQHKVPRNDGDNLADYLLTGIRINRIAVDAANRKWMASATNGVYLISSDCNEEIHHFTHEDSKLPSDECHDIFCDNATGKVYIATTRGLCAYQSDITDANNELSKESVYAYPNPITPDFTGDVTIVGLQPSCDVRIVNTAGQLVAKGISSGGTFQWDGCNSEGKRVASGVYMVLVANSDGSQSIATKIAVIR